MKMLIVFCIAMLFASTSMAFTYQVRGQIGNVRASASYSTRTTHSHGISSRASLPIHYKVKKGRHLSSAIAYEGETISTNGRSEVELFIVPEPDRSIMWMTIARSGTTKVITLDPPRFQFRDREKTRGIAVKAHPSMAQEILTITVQYCDARRVPDGGPQEYEYTFDTSVW